MDGYLILDCSPLPGKDQKRQLNGQLKLANKQIYSSIQQLSKETIYERYIALLLYQL